MRRVGWLDRAGPHWRHRGQRPSRAAQTQAPRRQAQCGRSRLAQSCSLHASGAVPGKDHSTHRSAVEKGADAQLAAGEAQPSPLGRPLTSFGSAGSRLLGWGQVGPSEVWVQFAGMLALQREPWCLFGRVRARWARGGPRGADCIVGVLCPDPGHSPAWPAEGPVRGHRAHP